MDILGMLQNDLDELCQEDLDMLRQELDIGDYPFEYKEQCRLYLIKATRYFEEKEEEKGYLGDLGITKDFVTTEEAIRGVETNKSTVTPEVTKPKTNLEIFVEELNKLRSMPDPEENFLRLVEDNDYVTNDFIDQHFKEFSSLEIEILIRNRQFSEEFLEKYFDELNIGTVTVYQLFSEEFFMRHFDKMNPKLVITNSKNPWRTKSQRSSKLSTFLRLKGVKI